ncbi:GNAT family N-acetyltransferase [Vibrio cionasavignyae]|uniref:GNAT family N-acetyltransferase n=1 Tax=Vibrio cionasavignyae TaxID=2910252 RepID=UPI003D12B390
MTIEYIKDSAVEETLNQQLITLLSACFTKPSDERFKTQRYYNEMPAHRWYIKDSTSNLLVAHLAVHEKHVYHNAKPIVIGGIAEVCVHPEHRGQGYVKQLLEHAHIKMAQLGMQYSILFGRDEVYSSSGYKRVTNFFLMDKSMLMPGTNISAMVRPIPLQGSAWPTSRVELRGLTF